MAVIALGYDRLGSRLRRISDVEIGYAGLSSAPRRLGAREIGYWRGDIRSIGQVQIEVDDLLNGWHRPRTLGSWDLEYDLMGSRLTRVGPWPVTYQALGTREHTLGPMTVEYDRLGSRPSHLLLPDGDEVLSENHLLLAFFVLHPTCRRLRSRPIQAS